MSLIFFYLVTNYFWNIIVYSVLDTLGMLRTLAYWHSSLSFRRPYYSNSDHWYHHYSYSLLTIPSVVWSSCISWLMWTLKQFYEIRRAAESSVILWMWATFPDNVSDFLKIVHLVSLASGLKSRFFQSKSIVFTTRLLWLGYYLDSWRSWDGFNVEKKIYVGKMIAVFACLKAHSVSGVLISLTLKLLRVKLWIFVAYACFYFGYIRTFFFLICRVTGEQNLPCPVHWPLRIYLPHFIKFFPIPFMTHWSSFLPQDLCTSRPSASVAVPLSPQFCLAECHVSLWTQLKDGLPREDFPKRMTVVCQLH